MQTTQRQYPFGDLAANVLGYVSQISSGELNDSNFHGLKPGAEVGARRKLQSTRPIMIGSKITASRTAPE